MTRIDLRDANLDTIQKLVGAGFTGQFAIVFDGASLIVNRSQARAVYEMLASEFADEYVELDPEDFPLDDDER